MPVRGGCSPQKPVRGGGALLPQPMTRRSASKSFAQASNVSPTPARGADLFGGLALPDLAGKGRTDIRGRNVLRQLALRLRVDPDHFHVLGALQERQRIEDGARRLASRVPGDKHLVADPSVGAGRDSGVFKHGGALDGQSIGDVTRSVPAQSESVLLGNDEIGGPRVWQNALRDAEGAGLVLPPAIAVNARPCVADSNADFMAGFAARYSLTMGVDDHWRHAWSVRNHRHGWNDRQGE